MALLRSLALSLAASFLATAAARRILSVSEPADGKTPVPSNRTIVVVIPMFAGNSNNRIGWVREVHVHRRPLFGRPRR